GHDREPPHGFVVEAVHERSGGADRLAQARVHEPASAAGDWSLMRAQGAFEQWLDRQYQRSVQGMLVSISPVGIVKHRPGFGHTIHPVKGSIIASPALADWNPEPDYFFHWFRDSAVVIDSLRRVYAAGDLGAEALEHF